jgi:hypothetical protein
MPLDDPGAPTTENEAVCREVEMLQAVHDTVEVVELPHLVSKYAPKNCARTTSCTVAAQPEAFSFLSGVGGR